jgi:TPR repeat protein
MTRSVFHLLNACSHAGSSALRAVLALGLMIAVLVGTAVAGPIEDATAAFQRGDYATAMRILQPLANRGDATAQTSLGWMYYHGQGVPQNYAEALKWSRKAADQGKASAQDNLGRMYQYGQGVPQNHAEAVRWYRKAAEQGDADTQNTLGWMYQYGQSVTNYAEAVRWYRKAADQDMQPRSSISAACTTMAMACRRITRGPCTGSARRPNGAKPRRSPPSA